MRLQKLPKVTQPARGRGCDQSQCSVLGSLEDTKAGGVALTPPRLARSLASGAVSSLWLCLCRGLARPQLPAAPGWRWFQSGRKQGQELDSICLQGVLGGDPGADGVSLT